MDFSNSDQLKSYLKKESKRLNISILNTYNTYFSRLLLKKVSENSIGKIIVKGSFSQMVHAGKIIRPVTDLDLTSIEYHNLPLIDLYKAMYTEDKTDIIYELKSIPTQTKTGIYKLKLEGLYGKIKHPLSVDYKENNQCVFEIQSKKVPAIFEGDTPYDVLAPSFEEHLAEKLCIILENNKDDVLNTRVKDFYDIYKLHGGNYDSDKLSYYFVKMIEGRGKITKEDIDVEMLNSRYIRKHQNVWDNISEKYEFLDREIDFAGAVYYTKGVLSEQVQRLNEGKKKIFELIK